MARKRGNSEGSIYQRKDGTWAACVSAGRHPATGKPERRYAYAKTRKEASEKLLALQAQIKAASSPTRKDATVAQLMEEYLTHKHPQWRETTYRTAQSTIANHIVAKIGAVRLSELDTRRVMLWLAQSPKTRVVSMARVHLLSACRLAVQWEWMARNPVEATDPPKTVSKPPRELTREQITAILAASKKRRGVSTDIDYWPIVAVLIGSGLRISEALGLRWRDWDEDNRLLTVAGQLSFVSGNGTGEASHKAPKTRSGTRLLTVPGFVASALSERRATQTAHKEQAGEAWTNTLGLIFTTREGKPLSHHNIRRGIVACFKAAGVEDASPHDLRHAHASLLLDEGIPIPVVATVLGHADPGITLRIYAHKMRPTHAEVAAVLEGLDNAGEGLDGALDAGEGLDGAGKGQS